ncbi:MAG TPA: ASCH domain-containing protein [Archangium sp.]
MLLVRDGMGDVPAWRLPAVEPRPGGRRPLLLLKEQLEALLEMPLPAPAGSCGHGTGDAQARDFAFLLSGDSGPPGAEALQRNARAAGLTAAGFFSLATLTEVLTPAGEQDLWWDLYCGSMLGGHRPSTRALDVFSFGAGPRMAAQLAHLVIKGSKRWTTGFIAAMERQGALIPHVGLQSIVTDGFGIPLCLLQTVEVRRVRFGDVTHDVAVGEGEGDLSFEDWHESHVRYFSREARELGLEFTDDSLVFNERFEVLKVFASSRT